MELKRVKVKNMVLIKSRLNRTFYGIETEQSFQARINQVVLIVPFMELKLK